MKKIKHLFATSLLACNAFAQQPPTPNIAADPALGQPVPQRGNFAWYRGGNSILTGGGTNNIFGTLWNSPVYHYTGGLNRMALFSNVGSNGGSGNGALAINHNPLNPITAPTSLLNVGEPNFFGQQPWMRVGTTYGLDNDMAYFGLKREGVDRVDAIIAWGNDQAGTWGPDVLRFHHTSTQSEMARFAPNGGNGFGNFYNYGINTQPVRRVEILDADPNTGVNANVPQLRTTYTYNATPTGGVFTEFQTTSVGDMYFNTRSNGNTKNFGFHKFNPLNTVEISAQINSPYLPTAPIGSSGLRFTSLTSANNTVPNGINGVNSAKVLTVDGNGDVVLTDANATPTTNNGISISSGTVQLGVDCSSPIPVKIANRLLTDRMIHLNGNNMIFADGGRVGIGQGLLNCTVGNKLEINSGPGMPYWATVATNGSSGLRLTHLTSAKTPIANGVNGVDNTKVLTVDANGDVVLVDASSSASLGNVCGATSNPLTADWEIPLNGYNYVFSDPATLTHGINNVRVGSSCNTPAFNAKFEVWRNSGTIPSTVNVIAGVLTVNSDKYPSYAPGQNSYGGYFIANGGSSSAPVNAANYGVVGIGRNGRTNYGGYFEAAQPSLLGYGIYAKAISNGLGTGSLAGYFDGDIFINGVGNGSSGIFYTSDSRLKTNIDTITNAIAIIKQLKPKTFYYDTTNAYGLRLSNKKQYGFIAQDVQTVLPELIGVAKKQQELDSLGNVVSDSITYNTVNYNAIIGLLTKAIQQQQSKIDSLTKQLNSKDSIQDARLTALENAIAQCCSNASARNANINQLDVELSDKDAIVLNQNVPNPFAEQTTITYNVPSSVEKAQLIFFNSNGQVIQTVDIKTRGKGKVNVFAADLSSGLYHYTLVADGKVVDSKKMVRE